MALKLFIKYRKFYYLNLFIVWISYANCFTAYSQLNDSSDFYYNVAVEKFLINDLEAGIKYCNKSINFNRENLNAIVLKGSIFVVLGYNDSALFIFNKIDEGKLKGLESKYYLAKGEAEYNLKQYDKSIIDLKLYLKNNPMQSNPLRLIGLAYFHEDKSDSSIKYLNKSIEIKDDSSLYYFLAKNFMNKMDYVNARKYYERSILKGANLYYCNLELSNLELSLENCAEAEIYSIEALAINPKSLKANQNLAYSLLTLGKLEELMKPAIFIIKKMPNDPLANFYLGMAYAFLKDSINGLPYFNKSIELSNRNPIFVESRGIFFLDLGMYPEALEDILFAYNEGYRSEGIELRIAECYNHLGNDNEAESFYRLALQTKSIKFTEEVCLSFGVFELSRDNLDSAEVYLKKCLSMNPFNPEALYQLSKINLMKENYTNMLSNTDVILKHLNFLDKDTNSIRDFINNVYFLRTIGALIYDSNDVALKNVDRIIDGQNDVLAKKHYYKELIYISNGEMEKALHDISSLNEDFILNSAELTGLRFILLMYYNKHNDFSNWLIKCINDKSEIRKDVLAIFPENNTNNAKIIKGLVLLKKIEKGKLFINIITKYDEDFFKKVLKHLQQVNQSDSATDASKKAQILIQTKIDSNHE